MKLKIVSFKYKKGDSNTSRQILVLSEPSDSYLGVEFDEDDMSDIGNFLDYLEEKEKMDEYLKQKYDVKSNPDIRFRRFKEDKITYLIEEKVTI